ncbi:hypothetical protein DFQ26_002435 [Actinomortierella ambigua]|nr:hypothetical protein DFQ26_002435 [Actinomortierella ambigua]
MATLPLLEHGLRRIYVHLNGCKPDREHALVGGDYYVTLDVILDPLVPEQFFNAQYPAAGGIVAGKNGTRGQPNQLLGALGPERVNICYDLFVCPSGPRLRDRASHGEVNHLLGTDITGRDWFHMYVGLVLSLMTHFPKKDHLHAKEDHAVPLMATATATATTTTTAPAGSSTVLKASIGTWVKHYTVPRYDDFALLKRELLRALWTLWTNSATAATVTGASQVEEDMGSIDLVHSLFHLKEQASHAASCTPPPLLMFNRPVVRGKVDDVLAEAGLSWHHLRSDNVFTQSLSGWSTIVHRIQQALEKTSSKFEAFREEEESGKMSTRKWRQFSAMKEAMPRLWGMLAACLCLVEFLVLHQPDEGGDFSVVEQPLSQAHPVLVIPPIRRWKESGQQKLESMKLEGRIARLSKQEVLLRVKMMAFVDRFLVSMEQFSLEAVEQAWESLCAQLGRILVEQYFDES